MWPFFLFCSALTTGHVPGIYHWMCTRYSRGTIIKKNMVKSTVDEKEGIEL